MTGSDTPPLIIRHVADVAAPPAPHEEPTFFAGGRATGAQRGDRRAGGRVAQPPAHAEFEQGAAQLDGALAADLAVGASPGGLVTLGASPEARSIWWAAGHAPLPTAA